MYAVYHGPEGLKTIAGRVNGLACVLAEGAKKLGHTLPNKPFFDTVAIQVRILGLWLALPDNASYPFKRGYLFLS